MVWLHRRNAEKPEKNSFRSVPCQRGPSIRAIIYEAQTKTTIKRTIRSRNASSWNRDSSIPSLAPDHDTSTPIEREVVSLPEKERRQVYKRLFLAQIRLNTCAARNYLRFRACPPLTSLSHAQHPPLPSIAPTLSSDLVASVSPVITEI